MIDKAHIHACSEILYFIGGDPMNFAELGMKLSAARQVFLI
jgi:hypothetical protein